MANAKICFVCVIHYDCLNIKIMIFNFYLQVLQAIYIC